MGTLLDRSRFAYLSFSIFFHFILAQTAQIYEENPPMVPICSKKVLLQEQNTSTTSLFERIQSVALKLVLSN